MDNRSNEETDWDFDLLGPELADLKMSDFDLALTGFDPNEIDNFLLGPVDEHADDVPPVRWFQCRAWATCGCAGRTASSVATAPVRTWWRGSWWTVSRS